MLGHPEIAENKFVCKLIKCGKKCANNLISSDNTTITLGAHGRVCGNDGKMFAETIGTNR